MDMLGTITLLCTSIMNPHPSQSPYSLPTRDTIPAGGVSSNPNGEPLASTDDHAFPVHRESSFDQMVAAQSEAFYVEFEAINGFKFPQMDWKAATDFFSKNDMISNSPDLQYYRSLRDSAPSKPEETDAAGNSI